MARYKHLSKKLKLIKQGRRTRWAPFWTVPKIYGAGRRVHPGRHTAVKRNWRRTKINA
jgi:ribosomal protein L39E